MGQIGYFVLGMIWAHIGLLGKKTAKRQRRAASTGWRSINLIEGQVRVSVGAGEFECGLAGRRPPRTDTCGAWRHRTLRLARDPVPRSSLARRFLLKRTSDKTETARGASRGRVGDVSDFRSREHSNHLAIPLLLTVQTRMDNYPGRFGSPVMLDVKFERYLPSKAA